MRSLVLRVDGTNCEQETVLALRQAGSAVTLAHINEILRGYHSLEDFQALILPGGFTYGDHISAGKIVANILQHKMNKEMTKFIENGSLVLGICNGFQSLLKSGFLDVEGATLGMNDSGLFIDRWVLLNRAEESIISEGIDQLFIPINHGEGKFIGSESTLNQLEEEKRIIFRYVDNPNGSYNDIAGIRNKQGNVMGLMPHPEKYIHQYQHPCWTRLPKEILEKEGAGMKIFKNLVRFGEKF